MLLRDRLENIGGVFFRYRSFIPLAVLLLIVFEKSGLLSQAEAKLFSFSFFGPFCALVSAFGFLLRVVCVGYSRSGTSGRGSGQGARRLNKDGLYSLTRHPLYLANFFLFLGTCAFSRSIELVLVYIFFFFSFYVPIMLKEESFLAEAFGQEFLDYASRTPVLISDLALWTKPELSFNGLRVLWREHDTCMGVVWGFCVVKIASDSAAQGRLYFDSVWLGVFAFSVILWGIIKIFKKNLKSLDRGL